MSFTKVGNGLKNTIIATIVSLKTFSATTVTATSLAQLLGNAFNIARIKAIALQATLSLGLSLGITLLIEGINKLVGKYQDLNDSQEHTIKNQANEVIQVSKLVTEMEKLKSTTQLNADEKDRLIKIEQQLAELLPKATTGYDEQNIAPLLRIWKSLKELNEEKRKNNYCRVFDNCFRMEPDIENTKKINKREIERNAGIS